MICLVCPASVTSNTVGLTVYVHAAAACAIGKSSPAISSVTFRAAPVFGSTTTETFDAPLPLAGFAFAHDVVLDTDQAQPGSVVIATWIVPPPAVGL